LGPRGEYEGKAPPDKREAIGEGIGHNKISERGFATMVAPLPNADATRSSYSYRLTVSCSATYRKARY